MEGEEIRKKRRRISMSISVGPSVRKGLLKVKEIGPQRISSALIEFCTMSPYSLGNVIFALEVLKSTPEGNKRLIMCFSHNNKDYEEAAKIIKEVLDRKREKEYSYEDAVQYIKDKKEGKTI